jgi:hypothetical protein
MVAFFEKEDGFCTFPGERDRSWSSNCHVLLALLQHDFKTRYASQIHKAVIFITKFWWSSDGFPKDKWVSLATSCINCVLTKTQHLSHLYPAMLMVQAFAALLRSLDGDPSSAPADQELVPKVLICVFQACMRTLHEQRPDGSWGNSSDDTAFAILTLAEARQLCIFKGMFRHIERTFLVQEITELF